MELNKPIGESADRDKVKNEREARRLAKIAAKQNKGSKSTATASAPITDPSSTNVARSSKDGNTPTNAVCLGDKQPQQIVTAMGKLCIDKAVDKEEQPHDTPKTEQPEKKPLSKAERRAVQEAQRAAKTTKQKIQTKSTTKSASNEAAKVKKPLEKLATKVDDSKESNTRKTTAKRNIERRVKLFNHLYTNNLPCDVVNSNEIHPAIVQLGVQYSNHIVKGCNARGLAFMNAMKSVIVDYKTPSQKEFSRGLEDTIKLCANYLHKCRPLAVSMTNAMKYIQYQLRQLHSLEADAEVISNSSWTEIAVSFIGLINNFSIISAKA